MSRFTASPLMTAAIVLAVGACAHAQGPDPAAAPEPVHAAAAEQLGEEPRMETAPAVAVAPTLLGTAKYDLPVEANQWVQSELNFLVNQRHDVIGAWLQRADYYQDWVRQVFQSVGVPQDLSHLAMVESGYLPTARSHAGAVGMWQFMAGTGKGLGLRVDDIVDERMDPVRSTYAAARHLRDLNQVYNGDWALAVAAYNAGTGRISRGLRTYNVATFWDLAQAGDLADETKRYVPRLYAVTIIGHDPARFGYGPAQGLVRHFAYDSVRVDVMTPLAQLAETGGVPLGDLVELNPHLVRQTAPADYWVWTPKGTGAAIQSAFNASDFRRGGGYAFYVVRPGDDFTKLATAAGLSVDQIRAMNPHVDVAGLSRGQRLVFPVGVATMLAGRPVEHVALADASPSRSRRSSANGGRGNGNNAAAGDADDSSSSASSSDDSRSSKPNASSDRTSSSDDSSDRTARARRASDGNDADSDRPKSREAARPRTFEHTVRRGETLASLAERFDVPASRIRSINEMESNRVHPGMKLRIPRPAAEQTASSDRSSRSSSHGSDSDARPRTFEHTVKRGETLASLAERFDVPPSRIRSLNEMESSRVHPGQVLRIPRPADEQTASADRPSRSSRASSSDDDSDSSTKTRRSDSGDSDSDHSARSRKADSSDSDSDGSSRPTATRTVTHTVTRGETLASIAEKFDVPPSRIRSLNEMETSRVHPGQRLRIPRPAGEQTADSDRPSRRSSTSDGESSSASRSRDRTADADRATSRRSSASDDSDSRPRTRSGDSDAAPKRERTASSDRTASSERSTSSDRAPDRTSSDRTASSDRTSSRRGSSSDDEKPASSGRTASSRHPSSADGDKPSSERTATSRRGSSADDEKPASSERTASSRRTSSADSDKPSSERTAVSHRSSSADRDADSSDRPSSSSRSRSGERVASSDRASGDRGSSESRRSSSSESRRSSARFTDHTVKRGETLYSIARRYEVSVGQIRNANDIGEDATISPGQHLRIPSSSDR